MNLAGLADLRGSLGTELLWAAVGGGFALVVAVFHGALAVQGRWVSPLRLALGAWLGLALIGVLGRLPLLAWDPTDPTADPALVRLTVTTFATVYLAGPLFAGPALAATLGAAAFVGGRVGPRRAALAVAAASLVWIAGGIAIAGGVAAADPVYASLRGVVYAAAGVLVGIAACAGPEDGPGRAAAAAAGATAPALLALGEGSQRGLVMLLIARQAEVVPSAQWAEAAAKMLAHVTPERSAGWAALGVAVAVSVVATVAGGPVGGGRRLHGLIAAGIGAALAAAVLWGSDLGAERVGALRALGPEAPAAP